MGILSNFRKHKVLLVIGICLVILILIVCMLMITSTSKGDLHLKHRKVHVEFGETISTNPKDYLDISSMSANEQIEYLKNVKVVKDTKLLPGKQYEDIGTYVVKISDASNEIEVKVIVEDTTSPKFEKISKIETFTGDVPDYTQYIKAKDIDEKVTISINDKDVKINENGEYKIKATAEDSSKNKATKEIAVIVKEKPDNSDVSYTVDENGNVIATAVQRSVNNNTDLSNNTDEDIWYESNNTTHEQSNNSDSSEILQEPDSVNNNPIIDHEQSNNSDSSEILQEPDSVNNNPIIEPLGNTGWQGEWNDLVERANVES